MRKLLAIISILLLPSAVAFANIEGDLANGMPISSALEKAVVGGMNIADATSEALATAPHDAAKIIGVAVKKYSDFAGEIVVISIRGGVSLRTVVISAIKGAPDKSGQIIAAAIGVMPEYEDVIAKYALDLGVPADVIARAIISGRVAGVQTARTAGVDIGQTLIPIRGRGGVVSPH